MNSYSHPVRLWGSLAKFPSMLFGGTFFILILIFFSSFNSASSSKKLNSLSYFSSDCCDQGDKPTELYLTFTGDNCSASTTTQDSDKWECNDYGTLPNTVYLIASDDENGSNDIYFSGNVNIDENLIIASSGAGFEKFGSWTWFFLYDSQGGTLLQKIGIHTSCSAPLIVGEQWGSLVLDYVKFLNGIECGPPPCDQLTDGGLIGNDQTGCVPFDPSLIFSCEKDAGILEDRFKDFKWFLTCRLSRM